MKLFACTACGAPLQFEDAACPQCAARLGYDPAAGRLLAVALDGEVWRVQGEPGGRAYLFCANAAYGACTWLLPAEGAGESRFCHACRHNHVIPDLTQDSNLGRWRKLEAAKKRLFYTLLALGLPLTRRPEDPKGLAFDFLADPPAPGAPGVMTGHDNGLVTIAVAEADDSEREARRSAMGEPYRTLLGHLRHEVGHYYWTKLVEEAGALDAFRALFGDERTDYGAALQRHYSEGPPADWATRQVSAYASAHAWEDWAETFAHYLHMVDTLETAGAFGLRLKPRHPAAEDLSTSVPFDPHHEPELARLVDAWAPLTFAVNALNRSMGQPDLYPFTLAPAAIEKLAFVHARVRAARGA
ncbi:putative zinc-binding metallopeptidase [Salinarimonas sp.]|uniref:zinc-binding metallopeptidase family protein n=1 Tax=Salinarimonas sp. TaxID=2766526 RepID=UPI0032D98D5B